MKLRILHRTTYRYRVAPRRSVQTLRLTPSGNAHQTVLAWQVHTPVAAQVQRDGWGNTVHLVAQDRPGRRLVCEARGEVQTHGCPLLTDAGAVPVRWWLHDSPLAAASQALGQWVELVGLPRCGPGVDARWALALADAVADTVIYAPGQTDVATTGTQAFRLGRGVCQDQAHVFIAACRSVGVPARYVSGYFHGGREGAPVDGRAPLASHAWAELCVDVEQQQWLGVDVTHRCLVDQRHVRLAVGPDYSACAPVRGLVIGGEGEVLTAEVAIEAIEETP